MKKNTFYFMGFIALIFSLFTGCKSHVDSHSHTFAKEWTMDGTHHWHAATCVHTGEVKDKAEHIWDEGTIIKQATEESEGEKIYKCKVCENLKTETISILNHTHKLGTKHEAVPGNCVTKEIVEFYNCEKTACTAKLDKNLNVLTSIEGSMDPSKHKGTETSWTITANTHEETYDCCHAVKTVEAAHVWNSGVETVKPTFVTKGKKTFICTVCSKAKEEELPELYSYPIDAETNLPPDNDTTYIYFGVFPKTIMASSVIVDKNDSITMGSNTYYKGNDGNYYAYVLENACGTEEVYKYTNGNQVKEKAEESYQYFKVEPIKWKILTRDYNGTKKALLLAEKILIGNIQYYGSIENREINSKTIYPNNYKYSAVRAYLNGVYEEGDTQEKTYNNIGFLQTAFIPSAQNKIAVTAVDNSPETTGQSESSYATNCACEETEDKIFLLSISELINSTYGFADFSAHGEGNARIRVTTDYAKARGAYQGEYGGKWMTRSPKDSELALTIKFVTADGWPRGLTDVLYLDDIVPALTMLLE